MVYLRGGTVMQQPSFIDECLSLPMRLYNLIVFFVMTLIDVCEPTREHMPMRARSLARRVALTTPLPNISQPNARKKKSGKPSASTGGPGRGGRAIGRVGKLNGTDSCGPMPGG